MTALRAIPLIALVLAGCAAADPGESSNATSRPTGEAAADSGSPSATASASSEAAVASESPTEATPVIDPPANLLPPGSVARATADGLRVRSGRPGTPEHGDVEYTLNEGDVVLVEWSPLAYIPPSESPDGRGWYNVHVGGASVMSYIDGGVSGWVAAGEDGLEYLEHVSVTCGSERDLENLIYSPFTGGDQETLTTPWERLACNGDRPLELTGVLDYVCPEGGVYPYRFDPYLAVPQWCSALMIDAIDADGNAQYGQGLIVRFPEFVPSDLARGDVLRLRGHFDDPASTSCSAETDPGFEGAAVDVPFLVLFCREQFVPDESELIDHRELAPSPWES